MLMQVKIINGQKTFVPISGTIATNTIEQGNQYPVTSDAVYEMMNTTPEEIVIYSDADVGISMQRRGKLAIFYVSVKRTVSDKRCDLSPYSASVGYSCCSTLIRGATVVGECYFPGNRRSTMVVTSNGSGQGQIVVFLE